MKNTLKIGGLTLLLILISVLSYAFFSQPETITLAREEAIDTIIGAYPELAAYKVVSLPPSFIEAKRADAGWDVGFIELGSGVPGVLSATCYHVTDAKAVVLIGVYAQLNDKTAERIELTTCEPVFAEQTAPAAPITAPVIPPVTQDTVLPYGDVTLRLGQIATFKDLSMRPIAIEEDSRCPNDVQCIQAGTVRVKVSVTTGGRSRVSILKLGEIVAADNETILLAHVLPEQNSKITETDADYQLQFTVLPQEPKVTPSVLGKCFIGGCSGQLCTERPDAISTCEYNAAYACYQSGVCRGGYQSHRACRGKQPAFPRGCGG